MCTCVRMCVNIDIERERERTRKEGREVKEEGRGGRREVR